MVAATVGARCRLVRFVAHKTTAGENLMCVLSVWRLRKLSRQGRGWVRARRRNVRIGQSTSRETHGPGCCRLGAPRNLPGAGWRTITLFQSISGLSGCHGPRSICSRSARHGSARLASRRRRRLCEFDQYLGCDSVCDTCSCSPVRPRCGHTAIFRRRGLRSDGWFRAYPVNADSHYL